MGKCQGFSFWIVVWLVQFPLWAKTTWEYMSERHMKYWHPSMVVIWNRPFWAWVMFWFRTVFSPLNAITRNRSATNIPAIMYFINFVLIPGMLAIVTERGVGILVFLYSFKQTFPVWGMAVSRPIDAVCRFVQDWSEAFAFFVEATARRTQVLNCLFICHKLGGTGDMASLEGYGISGDVFGDYDFVRTTTGWA